MTPEAKKQFNTIGGTLFGILGLGFFAVAAYVASVPAPEKPMPVSPMPMVNVASCRDVLQTMGYSARVENGKVLANDLSLEDPQVALTKATAAIGVCKMALNAFCMGEACTEPGVSFTLTPILRPGHKTATPMESAKPADAKNSASSPKR
jgi:hypothetical protein